MRLRDRFAFKQRDEPSRAVADATPTHASRSRMSPVERARQELKLRLHRELLKRIDLTQLGRIDLEDANAQLYDAIVQLLNEQTVPISTHDRQQLASEILHEVQGLGPIEPLMADPDVSDILVNTSKQVFVERLGKIEPTGVIFRDDNHLLQIIDRIVSRVGRRIDESSPMVDARLPDGSRVNAIIPPLALDGPILSIRRFGQSPLTSEDLLRFGSIDAKMLKLIEVMVLARLNILVSGGTGSGKTTLLNCMSSFIPDEERIVTIEDSAELQLQQPHVVRLETRPPNIEGKGQVTQRDLVRNSLRMRPDRIIVGEVRSGEALDMLQAMNTGHDGSISTIHSNSARDSLNRLEMMMQMAGVSLPIRAMRQQISSALNVIVHTSRMSDGGRRVMSISELAGMEGDMIMLQDIFVFERTGVDADGHIEGRFEPTGIRPLFLEHLKATSHDLGLDEIEAFLR